MRTHKQSIIVDGFEEEQNQRICLTDESGKHFFYLHDVLYLKGEGCYTTFSVICNLRNEGMKEVVTSHNLGYYEELLDYGFARANQRIIFNLSFISTITRSHEVVLELKHELIQVTSNYRKELYERLRLREEE